MNDVTGRKAFRSLENRLKYAYVALVVLSTLQIVVGLVLIFYKNYHIGLINYYGGIVYEIIQVSGLIYAYLRLI